MLVGFFSCILWHNNSCGLFKNGIKYCSLAPLILFYIIHYFEDN